MLKRIFVVFVLAAFFNYTYGCIISKKQKVLKEELTGPQEKIVQVVYHNGDFVTFNKPGGQYQFKRNVIGGVTTNGIPTTVPIDIVKELRISKPAVVSGEAAKTARITEVVYSGGKIVTFNEAGGRYDEAQRAITGTPVEGKVSTISADLVLELRTSRSDTISRSDFLANPDQTLTEIVTRTQVAITFTDKGGRFYKEWRGVSGLTKNNILNDINIDDFLYVRVSKTDAAASILATLGGLAAGFLVVLAIIAATKESCPFIYAYDGEQYVFDAEPLGGAICPGLAKTDYSRLEHLKPKDGKYSLLLRNEVEETQYLDEMKLVLVDHAPGVEVMPEANGTMHLIAKPVAPSAVRDERGRDLLKFMQQRDGIAWQTYLPRDSSFRSQNLRHELTFEFPKPPDAKTAKLLVNAGTALWGSNMIREMLQLRGDRVDAWYAGVNKAGPELFELLQFIEREELYLLKLHLKAGDTWVQQGFISGGGPLITEDRVLPLDVSQISGDKLTIRLNPPMGFWNIDYLGVEYGDEAVLEIKEVALAQAEDWNATDVAAPMSAADKKYFVMPQVGNWAKVHFEAPPQREGTQRSIFLKTSGYYEIQIDKKQPAKTELIRELLATSGKIVEYSMNEYVKWRAQQVSAR
jgi:hypothetical protein